MRWPQHEFLSLLALLCSIVVAYPSSATDHAPHRRNHPAAAASHTYDEPIETEYPVMVDSVANGCDSMWHPGHHGGACCANCGPLFKNFWIRGEYLLWSLEAMSLPPLVSTSPVGTAPEDTGVLGGAGTEVLFGNNRVGDSFRSSGRLTIGWWCDPGECVGYEASYLYVQGSGADFNASSAATPRLARPIIDTALGGEASQLIAHPDFLSGSVSVNADSDLHFFDLIRRHRASASRCHRLDMLFGYRYGRLEDDLHINQSSLYTAPTGQIISGTTVNLFDRFETENHFHGAEFGFDYRQSCGPWTLGVTAKMAMGVSHSDVTIDGATVTSVPGGGSATFVGGLLAQETNIGSYDRNQFAVLPEVAFTMTTHLNRCTQLSVGYHLMYWSSVVRAADQIDRRVSQFPPEPPSGQQRPQFAFSTDGFLAHGFQAGLQYQF